jgi:hypothetical protein
MDKLFVVQIQHESLHLDVDYNMRALAAINKEPSKIKMLNSYSLYIKGKDKSSNYICKSLKRNFGKVRERFIRDSLLRGKRNFLIIIALWFA